MAGLSAAVTFGVTTTGANLFTPAVKSANLTLLVSATDGVAPFDANDAAGNDSADNNKRIRTLDDLTYTVEVAVNGSEAKPIIEAELPKGVEVAVLPAYCLAGSLLSTLPPAPVPLPAWSASTLPRQQLKCVLGSQNGGGSTQKFKFIARIRGEVPNGTVLQAVEWKVRGSSSAAKDFKYDPKTVVSAAPKFDVSLNGIPAYQGYQYGMYQSPDSFYSATTISVFSVGGKGTTPAQGPLEFDIDMGTSAYVAPRSPTATYDATTNGGYFNWCAPYGIWSMPDSKLTGSNAQYSVSDSGTWDCQQPAGRGGLIHVVINNADLTGNHNPTTIRNPPNITLSQDYRYYATGYIYLRYPTQAIRDLGVVSAGAKTVGLRPTIKNFNPVAINGAPNTVNNTTNDSIYSTISILRQFGFYDDLGAPGGRPGNVPGWVANPGFGVHDYIPGQVAGHDGNPPVFVGQQIANYQWIANRSTDGSSVEFVTCTFLDPTTAYLSNVENPSSIASYTNIPANGKPAWIAGTTSNSGMPLHDYQIEYGTGATGAGQKCDDSDSPTGWTLDPTASQHGNDASLLASGQYDKITKVRLSGILDARTADEGLSYVWLVTGMTVRETTMGGKVPTWNSFKTKEDYGNTVGELWYTSDYNPQTHGGSYGDRAVLTSALVATENSLIDPATPGKVLTGATLTWKVKSELKATRIAQVQVPVTITETISGNQIYITDSATITPTSINVDAVSGVTTLVWNLGLKTVNQPLPIITFKTRTKGSAADLSLAETTSVISSPGDFTSSLAKRTSTASRGIDVPSGFIIETETPKPLVEIGDDIEWQMYYKHQGSGSVEDAVAIDVLPHNGDGAFRNHESNGPPVASSFHGTAEFVSIQADPSNSLPLEQFRYTKRTPTALSDDPQHASNDATGSTVWCSLPAGGVVVRGSGTPADCPASAAEVTAVRITRPGYVDLRKFNIKMRTANTLENDVFYNSVSASASGLITTVFSGGEPVTVKASTIGSLVWDDVNGNGQQDLGEAPVAGFKVRLEGSNDRGTITPQTTTTDANGKYQFKSLRSTGAASAGYRVVFDSTSLNPGWQFTAANTFSSTASDSDADPSILSPTYGSTAAISLPNVGQSVADIDAGITRRRSLSGRVYLDADELDSFDSTTADLGLGGVEVILTGTDGAGRAVPSTSKLTNADGTYSFNDLWPGTYAIKIIRSSVPAIYDKGNTFSGSLGSGKNAVVQPPNKVLADQPDTIFGIALNDNADGTQYDFSQRYKHSFIRGVVYSDANDDGVFVLGPDEVGLRNVDLKLDGFDINGKRVSLTTRTSSFGTGAFEFDVAVPSNADGYTITQIQPAGYFDGKDAVGSVNGIVQGVLGADGDSISGIKVTSESIGTNYWFGELKPVTISGFVWEDADNDGARSLGEPALNAARILLQGVNDKGETVTAETTTKATGEFNLVGLRKGTYTVTRAPLVGYLGGKQTLGVPAGTNAGTVDLAGDRFSGIVVPWNTNPSGYLFGVLKPSSTTGHVWVDRNADNVRDASETKIDGVLLTLTGTDDRGGVVNRTDVTDWNGKYEFLNLRPGTYQLTETQPVIWNDGPEYVGNRGGSSTVNDRFDGIVLANPGTASAYNFTERSTVIAGNVYVDNDRNSIRGAAENDSIPPVTLDLFTRPGGITIGTTSTAVDGSFRFANQPTGSYTVVQRQPAGYGSSQTPLNRIDVTVPLAGVDGLPFGETLSTLAGKVTATRSTGIQNLANVTVRLSGTDVYGVAVTRSTTTNSTGNYLFDELVGGTYDIEEVQPAGYFDGPDFVGSKGGTVGNDVLSNIALTITPADLGPAVDATGYNFTETLSFIRGFVYVDANRDEDAAVSETRLAGVSITIAGPSGSVNRTTDATGAFEVVDLGPGDYTITEVQPLGYGSGPELASNTRTISLSKNGSTDTRFGETTGSLSGRVLEDRDNTLTVTPVDTAISGVTIRLRGTNVRGVAVDTSVVSSADGSWKIDELLAGLYTLSEVQPSTFRDGPDFAGTAGGSVGRLGEDVIARINVAGGTQATGYVFLDTKFAASQTVY
jgi:SdrD B-like domain